MVGAHVEALHGIDGCEVRWGHDPPCARARAEADVTGTR